MLKKTVIITGAAEKGIGGGVALEFARAGYNLGLTYNKNKNDKFIEKLKEFGVDVLYLQMDISDAQSIKNGFETFFSHFDFIEAVVCNAGVCEKETLLIDMQVSEIERVINTNLTGTILCNQIAAKNFCKLKRGNIINIASFLGEEGCACESVYSASKAGIINLTKSLAQELGQFGIRVNSVSPGYIETNMVSEFNDAEKSNIIGRTPLGRLGKIEDVARVVKFLVSEEASFITGQNITVSGGLKL